MNWLVDCFSLLLTQRTVEVIFYVLIIQECFHLTLWRHWVSLLPYALKRPSSQGEILLFGAIWKLWKAGYDEAQIELTILEPPSVFTEREVFELTAGESFTVDLDIAGTPSPKLVWSRNGIRIVSNGRRMVTQDRFKTHWLHISHHLCCIAYASSVMTNESLVMTHLLWLISYESQFVRLVHYSGAFKPRLNGLIFG